MRLPSPFLVGLAAAATVLGAPSVATAKPNIERKGGQWEVLLGAAACMPGKAPCRQDNDVAEGRTRLSFGMGANLGYRWRYVFLGAGYNLGLLRPDYEVLNASDYSIGYQNSVFGVIRPILPLWRFDIGLDIAPGFSWQTFRIAQGDGDKDFSRGFAFKFGPVVDIFITRRIFLGAKLDLILNAHRETCLKRGDTTTCSRTSDEDLAGTHQLIFGLHLGGTFL